MSLDYFIFSSFAFPFMNEIPFTRQMNNKSDKNASSTLSMHTLVNSFIGLLFYTVADQKESDWSGGAVESH